MVAGKDGVFELDARGAVKRRIGTLSGAAAPRFLPGGRSLLVLQANERLVELELATGEERTLSGPWTASIACAGAEPVEVGLQADDALELASDGRHVCLELSDRNTNMASYVLSLRANLARRTFEARWTLGCDTAKSLERFRCTTEDEPQPRAAGFGYDFDSSGRLLERPLGSDGDGWSFAAASANERWLVLRGNQEDGDYIHFNLLVVDRQRGAVFPVPEAYVTAAPIWPAPLTSADLADPSRERLGTRAGDFVTESSIRFLDGDRLVIDDLLLFLNDERIVRIPGDPAR
ncbi:MAG TPA: hypothetical protein VGK73_17345 [Polyangiaceae bacterium]